MSSFAHRLRRSQSGRRASVASLIAIFVIGLVAAGPVAAAPAVPVPATRTSIQAGPDFSTGGDDVTVSRNQSKVWFNDGRWFGFLFDKSGAADTSYRIQSLT